MLCGWHTLSEIPLTGVPTMLRREGGHDVVIEVATDHHPVAKTAGRFVFEHSAESSLISIKDVAQFEIRQGRQIRVWPAAGATRKDIEIFLLGFAWATLCHQRGTLPLHASAIATRGSLIAFAGHSGAGKSTCAALLNSLGYELIADDVLPVSFNHDSMPGAWPYLRRLKLRSDAIGQLACTPTEMVSEKLDTDRYFVRPKGSGDDNWRRLERLYLLEKDVTDSHVAIERITGMEAVHALLDHTYHLNFIVSTRRFGEHLAFCTRLASKLPVYRLRWSSLSDAGKEFGPLLCAHLESGGVHK